MKPVQDVENNESILSPVNSPARDLILTIESMQQEHLRLIPEIAASLCLPLAQKQWQLNVAREMLKRLSLALQCPQCHCPLDAERLLDTQGFLGTVLSPSSPDTEALDAVPDEEPEEEGCDHRIEHPRPC